jgi:ketosteroid isomerase-like protein
MSVDIEVREAAARLVDAFARHDTASYFACFAPDATFVFHNVEGVLESRAQYEALWQQWETDGFAILGCTSSRGLVRMLGSDVGVFNHTVRTSARDAMATFEVGERETIVFQRRDGEWLGVHEHLSVDPGFVKAPNTAMLSTDND